MFEAQKKLLKRIEKRWFPESLRGRYLLSTMFFNLIFLRDHWQGGALDLLDRRSKNFSYKNVLIYRVSDLKMKDNEDELVEL